MSTYKPRMMETSTTTGVGDLTLAGAVTGYQTFNAGIGTLVWVDYAAVAVDANGIPTGDWEEGEGYLSGTTTLVRATPLNGSAALPVSFAAGTKRVFCSLSPKQVIGRGRTLAYAQGMALPS